LIPRLELGLLLLLLLVVT